MYSGLCRNVLVFFRRNDGAKQVQMCNLGMIQCILTYYKIWFVWYSIVCESGRLRYYIKVGVYCVLLYVCVSVFCVFAYFGFFCVFYFSSLWLIFRCTSVFCVFILQRSNNKTNKCKCYLPNAQSQILLEKNIGVCVLTCFISVCYFNCKRINKPTKNFYK